MNESVKIAPHAGMVLHREIGWHSPKKPEIGDRVSRWSPPIELPSYDVMKVRTQIPESVVRKVIARRESQGQRLEKDEHGQEMIVKARKGRKGSPAKVRIKTLPDRVYNAEVIWIDGWARDRNDSLSDADIKKQGLSGVRVFNVEVELIESDPERLREGFRATVEFPIETVPDAITVPESAVHVEGGVAKVKVKASVGAVERIVTLGPKSQGRVVITEGLKAGEKILVPPAPVKQRRSDSERNEDSEDSAAEGGPDNTKSDEATQNAAPAEATPPAPAAQPDKPNAGKTGGSDAKGEKKRRTRGEGGPKRGGGGGGKRGPAK